MSDLPVYTKSDLGKLTTNCNPSEGCCMVTHTVKDIHKSILKNSAKGLKSYSATYTAGYMITADILREAATRLQTLFPDSKITVDGLHISVDWN